MRLWLSLPLILLVACSDYTRAAERARRNSVRNNSSTEMREDKGGVDEVESAPPRSAMQTVRAGASSKAVDAGPRQQTATRAAAGSGGGMSEKTRDAGVKAAKEMKTPNVDAGRADAAEPDAGVDAASRDTETRAQNTGSCCSTSPQRGCGDAALRACVCEREPRCCSEAWDETCTRLVKEKHCQSGVRDCVCGYDQGQWQQAYCCQGGWNDTCESVAYNKCGATNDCP